MSLVRSLPPPGAGVIRVATFNMHASCKPDQVSAILKVNADIVALQEFHDSRMVELVTKINAENDREPFRVGAYTRADFCGNGILTRFPPAEPPVPLILETRGEKRSVALCSLDITSRIPGAAPLRIAATHLDHVLEHTRLAQLDVFAEWVAAQSFGPHVFVGDMNALTRADYTRAAWDEIADGRLAGAWERPLHGVTDRLAELGYVDARTSLWTDAEIAEDDRAEAAAEADIFARMGRPRGTCRFDTRIDYVFLSRGLHLVARPGSYRVVDSEGASDHNIVCVDLVPAPVVGDAAPAEPEHAAAGV